MPFYRVADIPTSSCILHTEQDAAVAQPLGDLELSVCGSCGFIQNDRFDQAAVDYLAPYEESQGSSATFMTFVESELARLAATYDLTGGRLLEVGCGKAEWLAVACRVLDMTGIGFDPGYVRGRVAAEDAHRFTVRKEFFGPNSRGTGDLVANRHTLEHVPNVREFLSWMADAARSGNPGVVFTEVPDTERILAEGAFWDVYYEHCSYFTKVSLTNLHRTVGLEVGHLGLVYGGQYLVADGHQGTVEAEMVDPRAVVDAAAAFGRAADAAVEQWRLRLDRADPARTVLWAATSKTVAFLSATGRTVAAAVDINPAKHGSFLPGTGTQVIGPPDLAGMAPELVVIMNPIYRDEIVADLAALGMDAEVLALGDALTT